MNVGRFAGKRVALYARYSSHLQSCASIEDQVHRCTQFIEAHGGQVSPELVFTDHAISGASTARSGFESLMKAVESKKVQAIITEDVGRLSRDFADSAMIFKTLQYLRVPLLGVGDGIDTSAKHAKMTFHVKSLMNEMYLDDLRDKTRRGLDGRARAGFSTGGLPYGYASTELKDTYDRVVGHRIEIDSNQAPILRRIYGMYLDGCSLDTIARTLNLDQVPPPRAKSRHRRKGWVASTIHVFLRNEAYVGRWTYGRREWVKVPGTNARRYRKRDEAEVLHFDRPELRIIDEELWNAVQARLATVAAHYKGKRRDKGLALLSCPGHRATHPLSGIMVCGVCGSPMVLTGGSSARYYRCGVSKKRGTCPNRLSLREDVARSCLLGAIKEHFCSPEAVVYLRERIAEHLGTMNRDLDVKVREYRERLGRTEARIGGLIDFISKGDQSEYLRATLMDLEAQAKSDKDALRALEQQATTPIVLPSPAELAEQVHLLEELLQDDPVHAREQLRKLFDQGRVVLQPHPDGYYIAESRIFPLMALLAVQTSNAPTSGAFTWYSDGCAGRI